MNKYISFLLILIFGIGVVTAEVQKLPSKVQKYQSLPRFVEPAPTQTDLEDGSSQPVVHRSFTRENSYWSSLVDSSTNGYGMYSGTTRPVYVDEDSGWFFVFRQWE